MVLICRLLQRIEEKADAEKLKALGCSMGQGYFYGRPVDAAATLAYLERNYRDFTVTTREIA